jgi:ATP-dependent Clp protease ATP-binding subunit ClpA
MMPKRLSVDARKLVLTSATEEARRRGDRRLGTDHLLLGLLHDEDSRAAKALGVSLADARAALDALDRAALAAVGIELQALGEGAPVSFGRRLPPLTSGARAVFKRAIDEGGPSRSGRIETTHFLLALLSLQRPDPAAELLDALGADRALVRRRLAGPAGGEAA